MYTLFICSVSNLSRQLAGQMNEHLWKLQGFWKKCSLTVSDKKLIKKLLKMTDK